MKYQFNVRKELQKQPIGEESWWMQLSVDPGSKKDILNYNQHLIQNLISIKANIIDRPPTSQYNHLKSRMLKWLFTE